MNTLLRYPGGKSRAVNMILNYIPEDIETLCSPFFGGGSVELTLAKKGVRVFGYDIFKPLVQFWQSVLKNPDDLADTVQEFHPLSRDNFYKLQSEQSCYTGIKLASIFYVLNRSSFSGSTLSGGMSPGHPRFNQTSIDRLRNFKAPNLSVDYADFKESITKHNDDFLYLDPPYLIKNYLYGEKGNTHKGFDHEGLYSVLKERSRWIMSYNDCPEIRSIYTDYEIIPLNWKYGMSNDKASKEILILNP